MTAAARERAVLVETFRSVGPDTPRLCGDWTTRDLAAHLIIRERRPDTAVGIMFRPPAGYTARAQDRVARENDWDGLVEMVASGPPLYSPFKLLDPLVNTAEMFIHHEDVRRAAADWQPRIVDHRTVAALRRMAAFTGRLTLFGAPARVTLRDADGTALAVVGKGPDVEIIGPATELVIYLSGRDAVRLEFVGDPEVVAAVSAARRSF